MVWYSHLFQNFPQFIVIHTVKGFGIVNKAEIDVFLELSCLYIIKCIYIYVYIYTYIYISLVAQLVKNLPAMQETRVQYLGQEDPLEREWQPTPVFLPGEFHRQEPGGLQSME